MRSTFDQIVQWFKLHAQTFDLFLDYIKAIYSRWHEYLWGAVPLSPFILWYLVGHPLLCYEFYAEFGCQRSDTNRRKALSCRWF
jgi:hypothetical protein